ncbi:MAG: GYF domain-containing protein [Verrucomicrobiota bacterium]
MFIILGGDGKEYGPSSEEQIKSWIREGRVDANTSIKKQGEDTWKKLADFPELTSASTSPPKTTSYQVDIFGSLRVGFELVIKNPMLVILGALLIFVALLIIQIPSLIGQTLTKFASDGSVFIAMVGGLLQTISGIIGLVLTGALYGGFYYYILRIGRGEQVEISNVFDGFKRNFVQLTLGGIVSSLLIGLGALLCLLPGIYLGVAYMFALPLIIDKEMGFWDAMELSRKKVTEQWWWILLFGLVAVLVGISGAILCGVGLLFTAPVACAMVMCAYETLFNRS